MRLLSYCIVLLSLFLGCNKQNTTDIDGLSNIIKADGKVCDTIEVQETYILLDTVPEAQIANPIKIVKAKDSNIWISDTRTKKIVNFTPDGKWIKTFSKFGQGPGEYLNITDFEITPEGQLYLLDGRLDKIMVYSSTGDFIKSLNLPFEADMFHILKNGNILFGLSAWDQKYGEKWKVALTDNAANVIKFMIPSDDLYDPNIWLGISGFTVKENGQIIYNREIDDRIFVFSENGEIESITRMDFGKYTVADKDKKNIEDNPHFENYRNIIGRVGLSNGKFMGNVWINGHLSLFVTDQDEAKIQLIDSHLQTIGFIDDYMVQAIVLNDDAFQLPDSIRQHLDNEGLALRLLKF